MSGVDSFRIWSAGARYDFWLDIYSVRNKERRELREELRSNLSEAASRVGVDVALANVGGMRALAREATSDGELRSRWLAGLAVGLATFVGLAFLYVLASLYYVEGVLDSEVTSAVSSSLFPFFGSTVEVANEGAGGGFGVSMTPGPVPFVVPLLALVAVAKPWRSFSRAVPVETELG